MRRPLTPDEQVIERKKLAIAHAMLVGRVVLSASYRIVGLSRWYHDNVAGSDCYGMSPHYHEYDYTNRKEHR